MSGKCPDIEKYLLIIRQILDNEASKEQEAFLMTHVENCSCCLREYELEQEVRTILKKRLENKSVPAGLADSIRLKILRSSAHVS